MRNAGTTERADGGPVTSNVRSELRRMYAVSFAAMLSSTIYNISLPNLWIFQFGFQPSTIGAMSLAYTLAFLVGPVIFLKLARALGLKGSLLLSVASTLACAGLQLLVRDPVALVAINAVNGAIDSMFWPGMHARLATLRASFPAGKNPGIFKRFGASVTLGALSGDIAGFWILATGGTDSLALVCSLAIMAVQLPLITTLRRFDQDPRHAPTRNEHASGPTAPARDLAFMLLPVPVMLVAELAFQSMKGMMSISFPFLLEAGNAGPQWVYLVSLLQQVAQLVAITSSSSTSARGSFVLATGGIAGVLALAATAIPGTTVLHSAVIQVAGSLCCGMVYAFSTRMLLARARGPDRDRLASANEMAGGVGFGVLPFVAGLVADVTISGVFVMMVAIASLVLCTFLASACIARARARRHLAAIPAAILATASHARATRPGDATVKAGATRPRHAPVPGG